MTIISVYAPTEDENKPNAEDVEGFYKLSDKFYIHCSVHHYNCFKIITNTMTLMDYPLFSGVVVIHSTCFELSGSSSSGVHFSCTGSLWYSV